MSAFTNLDFLDSLIKNVLFKNSKTINQNQKKRGAIMCLSLFSKVLVGDEKMILCRESDLENVEIQEIIKKAFPELLAGKSILKRLAFRPEYRVECCYKMFSSKFDRLVRLYEDQNNWDENPFIVLRVFEENGKSFCKAEPISIL